MSTTDVIPADSLAGLLRLEGRTALVTGAGQGIGQETAKLLAAQGAAVLVNDFYAERAEQVAAEIEAAGGRARACVADVSDAEGLELAIGAATDELGPIDILVNNAGNAGAERSPLEPSPPFWVTGPDEWQHWIDVNFVGVMLCTRAVVGGMVERGNGRVITVISDAGRTGEPHLVVYSGAKAGAAGFMRGLAKAVGPHGVTANCVALGAVRTPTTAGVLADQKLAERLLRAYPMRRFGEPDDAASLIAFLASDAASWITGQTYPVNGGYSMAM